MTEWTEHLFLQDQKGSCLQNDTDGQEGKEDNSDENQEKDKDENIKKIGLAQNKVGYTGKTNKQRERFHF